MKVAVVKETYPRGATRGARPHQRAAADQERGWKCWCRPARGKQPASRTSFMSTRGQRSRPRGTRRLPRTSSCRSARWGRILKAGRDDLSRLRSGQVLLGMCDPLGEPKAVDEIAKTGATLFALELIPRTTRAQSMDVLSSMATIIGYRAVLLAATELPKLFPMLMTAAGTLTAAKAFVIGAGVAGLQAIATAKRLGCGRAGV